MVLTNFEYWTRSCNNAATATNGVIPQVDSVSAANTGVGHSLPPQQTVFHGTTRPEPVAADGPNESPTVSHIASNGYYGFSYVNAAHELNNNNNNVNCVNDAVFATGGGGPVAAGNAVGAGAGAVAGAVLRCKKRCFARDLEQDLLFRQNNGLDYSNVFRDEDELEATRQPKRTRFVDDFAAQYCHDFFALPSNQMDATEAANCHMDMGESAVNPTMLQPQQVVDVNDDDAMEIASTPQHLICSPENPCGEYGECILKAKSHFVSNNAKNSCDGNNFSYKTYPSTASSKSHKKDFRKKSDQVSANADGSSLSASSASDTVDSVADEFDAKMYALTHGGFLYQLNNSPSNCSEDF